MNENDTNDWNDFFNSNDKTENDSSVNFDISDELERDNVEYERTHRDQIRITIVDEKIQR